MATALLAAWLLQAVLGTLTVAIYARQMRRPQPWPEHWPPALVLVPVRGTQPDLAGFLAGLAAQEHPHWRVVFAVETMADAAMPALRAFITDHPARASLVIAGPTIRRGQKVHNLLAALATSRPDDAVIVTLDADILPPPWLLRALLRPLATGQAPIATGYRWAVAADTHPASAALAIADRAIATLPPLRRFAPCWGGATALNRHALALLDLPRLWDRAVSDDLTLGRAAARLGLGVYAPLTVRPPSPVAADWRGALAFGVRQFRLLRLHAPLLWGFAAITGAVPVAGGLAAAWLFGFGHPVALVATALLLGLGRCREILRRRIASYLRAGEPTECLIQSKHEGVNSLKLPPFSICKERRGIGGVHSPAFLSLGVPIAANLLRFVAILGSALGRDIRWAGRRYRLGTNGEVAEMTIYRPAVNAATS